MQLEGGEQSPPKGDRMKVLCNDVITVSDNGDCPECDHMYTVQMSTEKCGVMWCPNGHVVIYDQGNVHLVYTFKG